MNLNLFHFINFIIDLFIIQKLQKQMTVCFHSQMIQSGRYPKLRVSFHSW